MKNDNPLTPPNGHYCKADTYPSSSRFDHNHGRYEIRTLQTVHGDTHYTIQDRIVKSHFGGDYDNLFDCERDCRLLNDMDNLLDSFHALFRENVFVCDTDKLFRPEVEYSFKRYTFKELLGEQNEEILKLKKENKELKDKLFECRKDYLIKTSDISNAPYLEDEIRELKKEIYGDD